MNVDEIKERTAKLKELLNKEPHKEAELLSLELLEGFLINQANATFFLNELYDAEVQRRQG